MTRAARLLRRWKWKIPPRRVVAWTSVAAAPLAIVVTVGTVMSFHFHELLKQSRDRVDHSYQVLDTLDHIFLPMEDAEAAQLAWVITGDGAYLTTFRQSVARIGPQMRRLRGLLEDGAAHGDGNGDRDGDGREHVDVDHLDGTLAAKLTELGHVIDLRSRVGFTAARDRIVTGPAKALSNGVRADLLALSRGERRALKAGQDDARRKERHTVEIGAAIALLSIVTRVGIAWLLRHLRRRGKLHLATS